MKISRRGLVAIGVSVTLVAAAIAIPVGIVYGTKPTTVQQITPVYQDYSKQDVPANVAKNLQYKWGSDLLSLAPAAPDAPNRKAADYNAPTVVAGKTTLSDTTPLGTAAAVVQFAYAPKLASNPTVYVTYALNVVKGTPRPLSAVPAPTGTTKVPYGTNVLPTEADFAKLVAPYGFKPAAGTPVSYVKADNSVLNATDLATLAAGQTFKARHAAELDTTRYEANDKDGNAVPTPAVYEYTYEVTKVAATLPPEDERAQTTPSLPFGTFTGTAFTNSYAANPSYGHYVQRSVVATVTKASTRSVDATHTNPAVGATVVIADLNTYNVGTEFTVTFTYEPDANHTGNTFEVKNVYTVTDRNSTAPLQSMLTPLHASYATTATANGNTALPTMATLVIPTSASLGGTGYDNGTFSRLVVSATNTDTTTADAANSPAVGTVLTWAQLSSLNAGVTFDAEIVYKPLADYAGSDTTLKQSFVIDRQIRARTGDTNTFTNDASLRSYTKGSDLTAIASTDPGRSVYSSAIYVLQSGVDYLNSATGSVTNATPTTAEAVMNLNVNARFLVVYTYYYNSNYTESANFVKPADRENGQSVYRVSYHVV